ncbi:MAG: hypothetical protein GY703_18830 [Gammaproteobacteria bacterium]|nr:hypothetical protein [Gammaproteobacteria bacterium]
MGSKTAPALQRGRDKLDHIPVRVDRERASPPKPEWLKVADPSRSAVITLQRVMREHDLHTVCEMETIERLYQAVRPGADYRGSLELLAAARQRMPDVPTKSGVMLGLGEREEEIVALMHDLRKHGCSILTLGLYLRPSRDHLPVERYVSPKEFESLGSIALEMGFAEAASGPLVRSSYRADKVARAAAITAGPETTS